MAFYTKISMRSELSKENFHDKESFLAKDQSLSLVKETLEEEFGIGVHTDAITVHKNSQGKPFVTVKTDDGVKHFELSISHTFPFVFTALHTDGLHIGCDIEKIRDFKDFFIESFLHETEIQALRNTSFDYHTGVTLAWSLKESFLKACGVGLQVHPKRLNMSSVFRSLSPGEYSVTIGETSFSCNVERCELYEGYAVTALTLPGGNRGHLLSSL